MKRDLRRRDLRLEKLTRQGIALMQEERDLALSGDLARLEEVNVRKIEFLAQMEALAKTVEAGGPAPLRAARREELKGLMAILKRRSQENQFLLKAAAAGVESARRQVDHILRASEDLGIYDATGKPIENQENASNRSQIY